jgi:hypothetical protein
MVVGVERARAGREEERRTRRWDLRLCLEHLIVESDGDDDNLQSE